MSHNSFSFITISYIFIFDTLQENILLVNNFSDQFRYKFKKYKLLVTKIVIIINKK